MPDLRTIECSLSIAVNPRAPSSGANIVGRIWHDDTVAAGCVITDGFAPITSVLVTAVLVAAVLRATEWSSHP